jgi:hypothetical protein
MANDKPATPAAEPREASLWPTAMGLGVLVLGCILFVRSIESRILVGTVVLLASSVSVAGILFHGVRGLWSLLRGRRPAARGSLLRAVMYLAFGMASFAASRNQGGTVEEFRAQLEPAMGVQEALRRLDLLLAAHPARYRSISFWGTPKELASEEYESAGKPGEGSVIFTWSSGEVRSTGAVADIALVLSKSRQVWFTFSTDTGLVRFFVVLDDRGLIKSVSGTIGHQA